MARDARTEQINVRLTRQAHDVLRALAFLEDSSEVGLVREVVDRFLTERAKDATVQEALRLLAHYRGRAEGTVADLPGKKGGSGP
ncbi:MAG: hypothetical protein ACRDQ5_12800 [Sciscionella sp.]